MEARAERNRTFAGSFGGNGASLQNGKRCLRTKRSVCKRSPRRVGEAAKRRSRKQCDLETDDRSFASRVRQGLRAHGSVVRPCAGRELLQFRAERNRAAAPAGGSSPRERRSDRRFF